MDLLEKAGMDIDVAAVLAEELMGLEEAVDWMDVDAAVEDDMEVDQAEVSGSIRCETCSHLWSPSQDLQDVEMSLM